LVGFGAVLVPKRGSVAGGGGLGDLLIWGVYLFEIYSALKKARRCNDVIHRPRAGADVISTLLRRVGEDVFPHVSGFVSP
jgi:hypothetical protein